jgi:hypothetical protein
VVSRITGRRREETIDLLNLDVSFYFSIRGVCEEATI